MVLVFPIVVPFLYYTGREWPANEAGEWLPVMIPYVNENLVQVKAAIII